MPKRTSLENQYRLPNAHDTLTREQVEKLLSDFEYFMGNFQQVVDKQGHVVPFKLNGPQRYLAKTLLPMVMKETRIEQRHNIVVCKCRQMGASTEIVALINYICAFVEGINNLNVLHVFPVGDAGGKFYENKVVPIVTGVHPYIAPKIERTFTSTTSRIITYYSTKGARRGNTYEIVSANASSIRGGTAHIALLDEVADYTRPYDLEAAISPAIPDYGFSLVVFLSTFSDKRSDYFLEKIKLAREDPEGWTLLFIPWYYMYPEKRIGVPLDTIELTEYDKEVIIPALIKDEVPKEDWGDCISWYHRKELEVKKMKQEYPTTVDEVLALGTNEKFFTEDELSYIKPSLEHDKFYSLQTDVQTGKTKAYKAEASPVKIFRQPIYGHKYMLAVDPIAATGDGTDFFAATLMDTANHEQVATIHGRGIQVEDWATISVELCKIYNRATICPESNMGEGFRVKAWEMGYYNWWYVNQSARANRAPGIRTTATSKDRMLDTLHTMIRNKNLIIHDPECFEELQAFERQVVKKASGDNFIRCCAPKGMHDDLIASLWIYCGTLTTQQIAGRKREGYTII